jgi:hypothetical protein
MARRPDPGKCIHCLSDPVERNWDHVFPLSWYPDSTPPDLEKWQVLSRLPCNSAYGKLENDFLSRVGLCLDPNDPASRSIVQTALRSMNPKAGRNPSDSEHRLKRRQKVLADTLHGADVPTTGIIPGMGNRWNLPAEEQHAVLVPADSFRRITEKIVRGLFYVEDGRFIEPPYRIDFLVLDGDAPQFWRHVVDRFGNAYARGPGIVVRRAVVPDDNMTSLFEIEFWKQFKTYATVEWYWPVQGRFLTSVLPFWLCPHPWPGIRTVLSA